MPFELRDIDITWISLVKAGANGKQVILKSADAEPTYSREIAIRKVDAVEGIIYGIVYAPDQVDSQGDFAKADEIKKAAYKFMKNRFTVQVDMEHDAQAKPAYIAESWILKEKDPTFPDEPAGAWAVGIKLEDTALISAVQKGEIAGLSMAGVAGQRIETEKSDKLEKNIMDKILKTLAGFGFKKADPPPGPPADDTKPPGEPKMEISALAQAVGDGLEKLNAVVGELLTRVGELEKSMAKSRQIHAPSGIDKTDADEKLGAEIAALVKRRK